MRNALKKLAWTLPALALGVAAVLLLPGALMSASRAPDTAAEAVAESGVIDGQEWDAVNVGGSVNKFKRKK